MHTQDIQPPPPEYTETLPIPEPERTLPQQPTLAAQPQYLPQQSPYNPENLTPQQRNARIGQEYRDGRKYSFSSSVLNSEVRVQS